MKISIITATYNREAVIGYAVSSLYSQTYHDFEHLVVDGGSTDNTVEFVNAHTDDRTVLVSEPDNGVCDAFNKGLARASGDIVGFLHSDDFFADENVLERVASTFKECECDLVYGDLDYVSSSDLTRIIRRWRAGRFSRGALKLGWMPPHPTVFVTRELLNRVGRFDCVYKISCDYDFLVRCLTMDGIRTQYIKSTLVKMRLGGVSNGSLRTIVLKSSEDLKIIKRHNLRFGLSLFTLLLKNFRKFSQFIV